MGSATKGESCEFVLTRLTYFHEREFSVISLNRPDSMSIILKLTLTKRVFARLILLDCTLFSATRVTEPITWIEENHSPLFSPCEISNTKNNFFLLGSDEDF